MGLAKMLWNAQGGVFSSEMAGKVKLSELEQEDASEDAWSEQAKEAEETEAKAEEAEERKEVDDWGAKMGWDPATEEHEQMWKDVEASVQAADPLADVVRPPALPTSPFHTFPCKKWVRHCTSRPTIQSLGIEARLKKMESHLEKMDS
jgi:hypothetical protein